LRQNFDAQVGRAVPADKTPQGTLKAVAIGNSFGNVGFFNEEQLNRLKSKKQDAANLRF